MFEDKENMHAEGAPVDSSADDQNKVHQDPVMELPEIPASVAPTMPTYPVLEAAAPEPKKKGSGWKLFAAAVALVAVGAGVGSATTMAINRNAANSLPIGMTSAAGAGVLKQASAGALTQLSPTTITEVYKKVIPSVVSIKATMGRVGGGIGSGFVVDASGYILTNHHVIDGATKVTVNFVDGTTMNAEVVGKDRYRDLALLKVDPGNRSLVAVELGDSDSVEVGELAIAIGSPLGNEFTVTSGIVSALNRDIVEENSIFPIKGGIQTDASINPGNSGGPLLNAAGQVIGINTAIDSPIRASVGLGFAVPVNAAKQVLADLKAGKAPESTMGYLGIEMEEYEEVSDLLNLSIKDGVVVRNVTEGSPAEQAGLRGPVFTRSGNIFSVDVITEVDGKAVSSSVELAQIIAGHKPGDTIKITVVRGKETLTLSATLTSRPLN